MCSRVPPPLTCLTSLLLFIYTLRIACRFTLTISANSKGCKNPENDPNAEKEGYLENGLPGFCRDKRALTAFLWLAFISWLVSLVSTPECLLY